MRNDDRVTLKLTADEKRIIRKIMLYFRNKVAREGKPTEDIDELIQKLW